MISQTSPDKGGPNGKNTDHHNNGSIVKYVTWKVCVRVTEPISDYRPVHSVKHSDGVRDRTNFKKHISEKELCVRGYGSLRMDESQCFHSKP